MYIYGPRAPEIHNKFLVFLRTLGKKSSYSDSKRLDTSVITLYFMNILHVLAREGVNIL